jgi:NADPH:quinone reductase-like Zn-dependent oxidoreductase
MKAFVMKEIGGGIGPRTDLTLGYHAVGVVSGVGSALKAFRSGDRLTHRIGREPVSQAGNFALSRSD